MTGVPRQAADDTTAHDTTAHDTTHDTTAHDTTAHDTTHDTTTHDTATGGTATGGTTASGAGPALNPRRWTGLWLLLIGPFLSLFDQFCVNLAAPSVNRSFALTSFEFQAVVGGYGLVYGLGLITGGRLGDAYGRLRIYRAGLLCFAVTSLLCGLAWSPAVLIAARLAQGASAALLQPQVLALIRVQFPDSERSRALSWYGVSMSLGMVSGQLFGGAIPSWDLFGLTWRPVFYVAVPLCLLAYAAVPRMIPADRPARGAGSGIDLAGVALSALGFAALLLPLATLREISFVPAGLVLLALGAGCTAVFVAHQVARDRRGRRALLPIPLFRVPAFVYGVLFNFTLYVASVPFFILLGLYLQDEVGLSPAASGLVFAPVAVAIAAGSRLGLPLSRRFGPGSLVAAALCTAAGLAGVLAVMLTLSGDATLVPLLVSLTVFGLGNGTSIPLVTGIVLATIPPPDAGAGSGVLTTAQQLGGAAGVAITGALLYPAAAGAPLRYAAGLGIEVAFAALTGAVAAVLILVARRTPA
ncbi:MFS transporter [Spirillospora sp. NPDC047279]|uniref:MFS transporter n=1 Tax=Spirillospora sp. NPDC047279 TaxID=3155478 RepID=UPI003411816B